MRKAVLLTIPLLIAFLSVLGWLAAEASQPPAWQTGLSHYLTIRDMTVQSAVRASNPWNFQSEMSTNSYASNPSYPSDTQNKGWPYSITITELITSESMTDNLSEQISLVDNSSTVPIAYPPEELWCVRLKPAQPVSSEAQFTLVFVARHLDLYTSGWIVHETKSDLSITEMLDLLSRLGCQQLVEADY